MARSKFFLWCLVLLTVASIIILSYRIIVKREYAILSQTSCNPAEEICFKHICDPENETCAGNSGDDTQYYKLIKKSASHMRDCNPGVDGCALPECEIGESNCEILTCSGEMAANYGDSCSDPEKEVIPSLPVTE